MSRKFLTTIEALADFPSSSLLVPVGAGEVHLDSHTSFGNSGDSPSGLGEVWIYRNLYVENNAHVEINGNSYLNLSGGTDLTVYAPGVVTLGQDPVQPLEAATKQYVDARVGGGVTDTGWVNVIPNAGFTNDGFTGYRRIGSHVTMNLSVYRSGAAMSNSGAVVLVLPVEVRPEATLEGPVLMTANNVCRLTAATGGNVSVNECTLSQSSGYPGRLRATMSWVVTT